MKSNGLFQSFDGVWLLNGVRTPMAAHRPGARQEINEAQGAQTLAVQRVLGFDPDKLIENPT